MATARLAHFEDDAARARDLVALGQAIGTLTVGRVDASDLYRFGLVQVVSALDAYVHGVVLDRSVDRTLQRLTGTWPRVRIGLHFGAVADIVGAASAADQELAARGYVAERLALETFQRPDDIAQAFAMVGVPKVWSSTFGVSAGSVTTALGLVVDRRNKIVHSCDVDPLNPGVLTPLSDADALDAIATVETLVRAIDATL